MRHREHPQVAVHREGEEDGRAPEEQDGEWPAGDPRDLLGHAHRLGGGSLRDLVGRSGCPLRVVERAGERFERVRQHGHERFE